MSGAVKSSGAQVDVCLRAWQGGSIALAHTGANMRQWMVILFAWEEGR